MRLPKHHNRSGENRRRRPRAALCLIAAIGVFIDPSATAQHATSDVDFTGIYDGSRTILQPDTYPFTPEGLRAHEAYDPLMADPRQVDDCAPESVPSVIWAGTVSNMKLDQYDDRIEIYYEHGGTTRTIPIGGPPAPPGQSGTPLGYSNAHWEDSVLVVETTHLQSGVIFTNRGFPLSADARIIERYRRETGLNLQMDLTVYDSVNYTEPVRLGREWIWSPDEEVLPWDCVSLGPRDAEPDIEALRELLNDL